MYHLETHYKQSHTNSEGEVLVKDKLMPIELIHKNRISSLIMIDELEISQGSYPLTMNYMTIINIPDIIILKSSNGGGNYGVN